MSTIQLPGRPAVLKRIGNGEVLVCTYVLPDGGGDRRGSVFVFDEKTLHEKRQIDTGSAVFRTHISKGSVLAAMSDGCLMRMDLDSLQNSRHRVVDVVNSDHMLLSLDVLDDDSVVVTTDSRGAIFVLDGETFQRRLHCETAHRLPYSTTHCEVWSSCWIERSTIATGGEDGSIKIWDVRTDISSPTRTLKDAHDAGCVFLSSRLLQERLVSSSYDQSVRQWDLRSGSSLSSAAAALHVLQLDGGVWDLSRSTDGRIGLACMYGGWAVANGGLDRVEISDQSAGANLLYGCELISSENCCHHLLYCTFNDNTLASVALGPSSGSCDE